LITQNKKKHRDFSKKMKKNLTNFASSAILVFMNEYLARAQSPEPRAQSPEPRAQRIIALLIALSSP
jgi:hypothetical protein